MNHQSAKTPKQGVFNSFFSSSVLSSYVAEKQNTKSGIIHPQPIPLIIYTEKTQQNVLLDFFRLRNQWTCHTIWSIEIQNLGWCEEDQQKKISSKTKKGVVPLRHTQIIPSSSIFAHQVLVISKNSFCLSV